MKILFRLAIGFLLFLFLLYLVDWQQTVKYLMNITLAPAVFALIILSLNIFVSSFKWRILLYAQGLILSWWHLTRCYWISTFFGNYLPTNVGGDVVRLIMMHDLGHSSQVAASILWERITGFVVLLGWSAVALSMRPQYFDAAHLLPFLWFAVGGGGAVFICLLVFGKQVTSFFKKMFKDIKGLPGRIIQKTLKVTDLFAYYQGKKREIILALIISVPFYTIVLFCNYFILVSVGSDMPLREVFFVTPIIPLVSLLPVSLNGIGLSEGAYVLFYTQAGLQPSEALAAAVIRRVIHLLISLVGGVLWLPNRSKALR